MARERDAVSVPDRLVALQDLDLLLEEWGPGEGGRGPRTAAPGAAALATERRRLTATIDPHWMDLYERCRGRYGRGLTPVRDRVCLGCQTRLPTSAAPPAGIAILQVCESCGRLLLWV